MTQSTLGGVGPVLVIDDDPVTRAVVGVMVKRLGHEVVEASDVSEARAIIDEHPEFFAVVCDYRLPDESGLDLLESRPTLASRFVLLTGTREREDLGDDRVAEVAAYLTKPVSSDEIADSLTTLRAA